MIHKFVCVSKIQNYGTQNVLRKSDEQQPDLCNPWRSTACVDVRPEVLETFDYAFCEAILFWFGVGSLALGSLHSGRHGSSSSPQSNKGLREGGYLAELRVWR